MLSEPQPVDCPSERGRNYTPPEGSVLRPAGASCGKRMIARSVPAPANHHRGSYTSPALAAASYPFVDLPPGNTLRCKLFPFSKFIQIQSQLHFSRLFSNRLIAWSMEKKGIISDRCELNRQIKADNALLRELKAAVKKLAQEVLHSLPELAKSMEFLRQKLLIFCYQLNHIRTGKSVIGKSVDAWNINLNRYSEVVDQIKETKRERTDLLAEKKELPFWNIPRKNELTARIAELTELLEELQSEKAILLDNMDCTDGKDVSKVRKKVALMEANLKELDEQEQKYSAELETALAEYAELKTQGEQFDPVELHDTRQELRPEMEQTAVQRVKEKYGDKYSHRTMDDSKRDVSRHLDEYAESQEIRQIQREREYQQRRQNKAKQERKKQDDWER